MYATVNACDSKVYFTANHLQPSDFNSLPHTSDTSSCLIPYPCQVWRQINHFPKTKGIAQRVVSSIFFHSVFQRGGIMWRWMQWGDGEGGEQPCWRERPYDAAVFSAVNNGRLVCKRKSRRNPRVIRAFRKLFRFPHYLRRQTWTQKYRINPFYINMYNLALHFFLLNIGLLSVYKESRKCSIFLKPCLGRQAQLPNWLKRIPTSFAAEVINSHCKVPLRVSWNDTKRIAEFSLCFLYLKKQI